MHITSFHHKQGHHCESSVLRDLIEFAGHDLSEPLVFGLDGTMGFVALGMGGSKQFLTGDLPFVLGGKNGTITQDSLACKILGLTITMNEFKNPDVAWAASKESLDAGIPLGIMIDMAYLPYMKEEFHFGGHVVSLVGYDETRGVACIHERDIEPVQEITIDNLKRGRDSKYGSKYLHPGNRQFTIMTRADGKKPPFPRAVKLAIQHVSRFMVTPSMNYQGLLGIKLLHDSIPDWKNEMMGSIALATLDSMHGFIEEYGTGGAMFRNLYRDFLVELANHDEVTTGPLKWPGPERDMLLDASDAIDDAAKGWSSFAQLIKDATTQAREQCLEVLDVAALQDVLEDVHAAEQHCFNQLVKIKP